MADTYKNAWREFEILIHLAKAREKIEEHSRNEIRHFQGIMAQDDQKILLNKTTPKKN